MFDHVTRTFPLARRRNARPQYHTGYFGAFVLAPDGSNIEVVNHNRD